MDEELCPAGGAHGWYVEEGSSGAPYRYCWKCTTMQDLDPDTLEPLP